MDDHLAPVKPPDLWSGNSAKTVHLCIDFQSTYRLNWFERPWWNPVKKNILRNISDFAALGIPTLYIAYIYHAKVLSDGVCRYADLPAAHLDQLNKKYNRFDFPLSPHDLVGFKRQSSITTATPVLDYLARKGYSTALLSGVFEKEPDAKSVEGRCVSISAKELRAEGFDVVILADATNQRGESLEERRATHAPWGVKVLESQTVLRGLRAPEPKAFRQSYTVRATAG